MPNTSIRYLTWKSYERENILVTKRLKKEPGGQNESEQLILHVSECES